MKVSELLLWANDDGEYKFQSSLPPLTQLAVSQPSEQTLFIPSWTTSSGVKMKQKLQLEGFLTLSQTERQHYNIDNESKSSYTAHCFVQIIVQSVFASSLLKLLRNAVVGIVSEQSMIELSFRIDNQLRSGSKCCSRSYIFIFSIYNTPSIRSIRFYQWESWALMSL